jgi:hypothetical protein
MTIKQVWITEMTERLVSMSMESATVEPEHMRLKVDDRDFPDKPTKRNPKRHVCVVGLLTREDLEMLRVEITRYLNGDVKE